MNQALPGEVARLTSSRSRLRGILAVVAGALLFFGTAAAPAQADHGDSGVIKGYVYADAGNDGYFDVDEAPVAGIEITLVSGGVEVGSVPTDEAGQFAFEGLRPGTYRVREQQPTNYRDGAEYAGLGGVLVDDDEIEITLGRGGVSSGHLFGELPAEPGVSNPDFPVVIVGQPLVFDPLANDGVLDDEAAFNPATVQLLDPTSGVPVTELLVPGQVHYRVLDDGRIEIQPQPGFVGWTAEVGYEAVTYDGRHSTSVIGVEVRERLGAGGPGRQVLPN